MGLIYEHIPNCFFPQVFMKTERRLFFNDFSYNYKENQSTKSTGRG